MREVLKVEGFAPLPRRRDDERPARPQPTVEAVADVREFIYSIGKIDANDNMLISNIGTILI